MKNRIFKMIVGALLVAPLTAIGAQKGNGGDFIRKRFLAVGQDIIQYLTHSPYKDLTSSENLDLKVLQQKLKIEFIQVTDRPLVDNLGSIVDSAIYGETVYLQYAPWWEKLGKPQYIDFETQMMVFHEMLRLGKYDDDNYRITNKFKSLEKQLRSAPLMDSSVYKGFGCSVGLYEKDVDNVTGKASKGNLLGTAEHFQTNGSLIGGQKLLLELSPKRVLMSVLVLSGNGYARWGLAEVDNDTNKFYVSNRQWKITAKELFSPYPSHGAKNQATTLESDNYLVDVNCEFVKAAP